MYICMVEIVTFGLPRYVGTRGNSFFAGRVQISLGYAFRPAGRCSNLPRGFGLAREAAEMATCLIQLP